MASPEEFAKKLDKALTQIKKDAESKLLDKAAEGLRDDMKARIRRGFGVSTNGGKKKPFKPLSDSYRKQRKNMTLSSETSRGKSNVTQTGDMIDSMTVKNGKVTLEGDENKKKAGYVQETRPFMHASKQEIKRVTQNLREQVYALLDRLL